MDDERHRKRAGGALIVLCGIDGSGKTVQSHALAKRAAEEGITVRRMSFPRYGEGFFADVAARYLRGEFGEDPGEVDPYLAAIPFAADRWEAAGTIKGWLDQECLVICNRYVSANLAHQGGKIVDPGARNDFFAWVERLEYEVFKIPRPHLHVWLDMAPQVARGLVARKGVRDYVGEGGDIHERSLRHLELTWEVYRQLSVGADDWAVVKCTSGGQPLPVGAIAAKVWEHVAGVLYHNRSRQNGTS